MSLWKRCRRALETPPHVPPALYALAVVGIVFVFGGAAAAGAIATHEKLFRWNEHSSPALRHIGYCSAQSTVRNTKVNNLSRSLQIDSQRIGILRNALLDRNSPYFLQARAALDAEEESRKEHQRRLDALKIQDVRGFIIPLAAELCLIVFATMLAARLLKRHGLSVVRSQKPFARWRKPYWTFVGIVFVVNTAREVYTSVYGAGKTSFGWTSFCVSPAAWSTMLLPALGFSMVFAYAATLLYLLGSPDNRPRLDAQAIDGKWGAGDYLLFIQTWSVLSLIFVAVPVSAWLRVQRGDLRLSAPYLATPAAVLAIVLFLSARLVRNAIAIRREYQVRLRGMGQSWEEIQALRPLPDPTNDFLGERWWQLPAVISGILAASWLVVEKFGVSDLVRHLTGL